jgi:ribonuclease VapC
VPETRRSRLTGGVVLDSWAILAWMQAEPSAPRVRSLLERAAQGSFAVWCSAVNAGEVYYQLVRAGRDGEAEAFWLSATRGRIPLRIAVATTPRVRRAASIKARYPLAYADAFALGLAAELRLPLATGDPEMRRPAADGLARLEWLGT